MIIPESHPVRKNIAKTIANDLGLLKLPRACLAYCLSSSSREKKMY